MIWLALWGRLRTFGGWASRNPLLALCGLLALFSAYSWHGWSKSEARRKADAVAFQTASDEARRQQAELRAAETQVYQEKAHAADQSHAAALADARSATDRYVAAHRVIVPSGQCAPVAQREADPASVRQDVPTDSDVAVSERDVRACGEWVAYGSALRQWALSVGE